MSEVAKVQAVECLTWDAEPEVVERKQRKKSSNQCCHLHWLCTGFAHRIRHKGYMPMLYNMLTVVISTHMMFNKGDMLFCQCRSISWKLKQQLPTEGW